MIFPFDLSLGSSSQSLNWLAVLAECTIKGSPSWPSRAYSALPCGVFPPHFVMPSGPGRWWP